MKLLRGSVIAGLIAAAIYIVIAGLTSSGWRANTFIGGGIVGAITAAITWGISMLIAWNKKGV